MSGRPDPDTLAYWAEIGVIDLAFGMPDRREDQVVACLARQATRLGLASVSSK